MKSLKKILALVLVLAMAISVVACSKTETTPADSSSAVESTTEETTEATPYTITISTQTGDGVQEGYEALAAAYNKYHPEATIVIDLKPGDGYSDWVKTVAADYQTTDVDLVAINLVSERQDGMSIDWNEYMEEVNPYDADGKIWKETFGYESQIKNVDGSFDSLSLQSVQVVWFYNADIFAEVGVEAPTTWDELVAVCEKLDAAGYQPIAIEGDYNSFYAMRMGWLSQIYADQTTRTQLDVTRAQPGDYCYDEDIDGSFKLDVTDPWNDDAAYVTINPVRFWAAVADGTLSADTVGTRTVWENFKKVFPQYAGGDAFFGTTDCMPAFYQGKAAMTVHVGGFAVSFANDMKKLAAGEEITSNDAAIEGVKSFTLGMFNMPSMEGEGIEAPARTIEVPNGFLGAFSKNAEHDAQVVDFVKFYSSAEGMGAFMGAAIPAGYAPAGPSLVYGVEYPEEIAAAFDGATFIGNCQKQKCAAFARGLADNQESTRAFYDLACQCLKGEITVDQYAEGMAKQHMQYLEAAMGDDISMADLQNPANEPTGNEG